ncbi:calponin [Elasticomyces elasticus]|uniref:Calponin n=1 Tax=Elasticomyces elasticus TaxID=574655 RepID=A0AAN7W845_9PEZI|nr:calponin [Elasticomyces elasticus]
MAASVSSLDADMRNLRLARYTPAAAAEVLTWIQETLGTQLPPGDLLETLKDGVVLCQLATLALSPPGIKFKKSQMPFIQMENISHFLRACEMPPLNMPAHDRFLTVDLFEAKDPAQVLQCLGAFSRVAHSVRPERFRTTIGPRKRGGGGVVSPTNTGGNGGWRGSTYGRAPSPAKNHPSVSSAMPSSSRAMSPALTGGSTGSQGSNAAKSPGPTSSWSSRKDEGMTSPAWNIHQYGYMGGASQGNQGISFGARRQITSQGPAVPSLADKERKRKVKVEEEERVRVEVEERRRVEEERERVEEERRWEDETRRQREEERRRVEEQKRMWEEQERRWRDEEEVRRKEAAEMQKFVKKAPERPRVSSSSILRGQSLSQYQKELAGAGTQHGSVEETPEMKRVRELEKQLEEARERERQYQAEREERLRNGGERSRPSTAQTERPQSSRESEASWVGDEREVLRQAWQQSSRDGTPAKPAAPGAKRPLPMPEEVEEASPPPRLPSRTLPQPAAVDEEEAEDEEPPRVPSRTLPQPTVVDEQQHEDEHDEDDEPPSLPTRSLQQADSLSSIHRFDGTGNGEGAPTSSPLGSANRPLPTPDKEYAAYVSPTKPRVVSRTEQFLAANTAPSEARPRVSSSREAGDSSAEQAADRDRRVASQAKTKAGGWAGKSLLEREMERERERQREWEVENQKGLASKNGGGGGSGDGIGKVGGGAEGVGGRWDVNQFTGYAGGDGMNRGSSTGSGIDFGGRRQIIGPRGMKK